MQGLVAVPTWQFLLHTLSWRARVSLPAPAAQVISDPAFLEGVEARGERLREGLRSALAGNPHVKEVRGLGLICGVQLDVVRPADRMSVMPAADALCLPLKQCIHVLESAWCVGCVLPPHQLLHAPCLPLMHYTLLCASRPAI